MIEDLKDQRYQDILETIGDICASPRVVEIYIGLTANPNYRTGAYRRLGIGNFAILATGKTSKVALAMERELFESIKYDSYWKNVRKKYNKSRIEGPYRTSLGGSIRHIGRDYSVYVAWKNR